MRTELDQQVLAYVEANVHKYFGSISKEKVREYFRPTLKKYVTGKFAPLIRTKLIRSRVKVWTSARDAGNVDDIQAHSQMCVALLVRSLYFQSKRWGLTLEAQHVRLADTAPECPCGDEF